MSELWIPVIAALGASLLTGTATFGIEWWRSWKAGKSALSERRVQAYSRLLTHSAIFAYWASGLRFTMGTRSGLKEGLNVTLGLRKMLDPLELTDIMGKKLEPLYEASSEVWIFGSKDAIAQTNDLIVLCAEAMQIATSYGKAHSTIFRNLMGERRTQEQIKEWEGKLRELAEARKNLGNIARQETGVEFADLFSTVATRALQSKNERYYLSSRSTHNGALRDQ